MSCFGVEDDAATGVGGCAGMKNDGIAATVACKELVYLC